MKSENYRLQHYNKHRHRKVLLSSRDPYSFFVSQASKGVWPFCVYMIPVQVFVPDRKSRPGTATGMNSFRYESYRYEILVM